MGDWVILEILVALLAGVVGGVLSRFIPALPKRKGKPPLIEPGKPGDHVYKVGFRGARKSFGSDLLAAKAYRKANPGAVLIADGVNRG